MSELQKPQGHCTEAGLPCEGCGSADFIPIKIHEGQTIRLDCANCGRVIGFPQWRGQPQILGRIISD